MALPFSRAESAGCRRCSLDLALSTLRGAGPFVMRQPFAWTQPPNKIDADAPSLAVHGVTAPAPGAKLTQPPRVVPAQELVDEVRGDPDVIAAVSKWTLSTAGTGDTRYHIGADPVSSSVAVYGCARCGATWKTGRHVCDEKVAAEMAKRRGMWNQVYEQFAKEYEPRPDVEFEKWGEVMRGVLRNDVQSCLRCGITSVMSPRRICDDCMRDEATTRAAERERGQPSAVAAARGVAPMLCVDDPCGDDVAEEA